MGTHGSSQDGAKALNVRFGPLDPRITAQIAAYPYDMLEALNVAQVASTSLDDLEAWLAANPAPPRVDPLGEWDVEDASSQ